MEQRISLITLGVADLSRARTSYERLGWQGQEVEETVFFQAGGMALVLWARHKLAGDAGIQDSNTGGFGGLALAHNVRSRAEVDGLLADAANAGAEITQAARETFRMPAREARSFPSEARSRPLSAVAHLITCAVQRCAVVSFSPVICPERNSVETQPSVLIFPPHKR